MSDLELTILIAFVLLITSYKSSLLYGNENNEKKNHKLNAVLPKLIRTVVDFGFCAKLQYVKTTEKKLEKHGSIFEEQTVRLFHIKVLIFSKLLDP